VTGLAGLSSLPAAVHALHQARHRARAARPQDPVVSGARSQLLQSDLDDAAAETAVRHYVEKLDEIA